MKHHIGRICEMINIVLDSNQWSKEHSTVLGQLGTMEQYYAKEMERLNSIYRIDIATNDPHGPLSTSRRNFLVRDTPIHEISPESKLFLERCDGFIRVKSDELEQSIHLKKQLYRFL
jgi:hypothetical protein